MFEPSKRLFLGNLPADVTKKDVSDFIRRRTRANPQHMEIGTKGETPKCAFAHCTVEGLKSVIEALNDMPLKDNRVVAAAAKPHFVAALQQARKDREKKDRDEEERRENIKKQIEERREQELEANGGKVKLNAPKSFYARRQSYAKIASEIANKFRVQHRMANPDAGYQAPYRPQEEPQGGRTGGQKSGRGGDAAPGTQDGGRPARKQRTTEPKVKIEEPPKEPVVSKEEKKLSNLQARLAALRAKIAK